ncbi:MAG: sugar ABC transporter permease [Propionibacteriaceae bacterium]|jgi:multiple sugar transport system permease protein|nr:sugar ABC transporter permease [Propionibacteriaceae bacterium]
MTLTQSTAVEVDTPESTKNRPRRARESLRAAPWLAPGLILIIGVVLFPAGYMIYTSTRTISKAGVDRGPAGAANYETLFALPDLPGVLVRTLVWVVAVVIGTVCVSLLLAHFLNKAFPGRRFVRLMLIIPWAASVLMTTMIVYYMFEPNYGLVNNFLMQLSQHFDFLSAFSNADYGFTKRMPAAFIIAIFVAIFVSLPFTTYTLLAGYQAIPRETLEAACVDKASRWQTYWHVTLPQLRPALMAASIINIINVYNSYPILKVMTGSMPGFDADTTTTMMFKILQTNQRADVAAALSVVNFVIVIAVISVYMWLVKPLKSVED